MTDENLAEHSSAESACEGDSKKKKTSLFWKVTTFMMAGTGFGLGLAWASTETLSHTLADNMMAVADAQCSSWAVRQYGIGAIAAICAAAVLGLWYWLSKTERTSPLFSGIVMVISTCLISGALFGASFAYLHAEQLIPWLKTAAQGKHSPSLPNK